MVQWFAVEFLKQIHQKMEELRPQSCQLYTGPHRIVKQIWWDLVTLDVNERHINVLRTSSLRMFQKRFIKFRTTDLSLSVS